MSSPTLSRRSLLAAGGATAATLALMNKSFPSFAAPLQQGDELIPWLDQPGENPVPERVTNMLDWQNLDSWTTPPEQFFTVSHYGVPEVDLSDWQLEITGAVDSPMTLTMDDLLSWPRLELDFTLECSGNHGFGWNWGLIGNAAWGGVPLAPLLREAGVKDDAVEVAFYGADVGDETIREVTFEQNFARSMSIEDATNPFNMLCYEMNGEALPTRHGYPLRLIAPGWYGIGNVKWLTKIEVRTRRLMNRWMARDYVTLRQEEVDGEMVWTESSVGKALLKSAPARVVSSDDGYRIEGAAWGQPIGSVEVKIDDGDWMKATLDAENVRRFTWRFWSLDWADAEPGEHTITVRAIDSEGNIQPAADSEYMMSKVTYWESNGQITRSVEIPA